MSPTEVLYAGRIIRVERLDERWEVVRHAPAVVILALNGPGEMLLVRQFRPSIDRITLEAPAGLIDSGEDPETAARRELQEETGFDADLTLLTRFYSSPGFSDEELFVFHAVNLRESRLPMDEDEDIEVVWMMPEQVLSGLLDGSIVGSASTVTAALFAARGRA